MSEELDEPSCSAARDRLHELRELGFEYLQTYDDASTWEGSDDEAGIPIDLLLETGKFRGNIVLPRSIQN